jgi:hypothetical protein
MHCAQIASALDLHTVTVLSLESHAIMVIMIVIEEAPSVEFEGALAATM